MKRLLHVTAVALLAVFLLPLGTAATAPPAQAASRAPAAAPARAASGAQAAATTAATVTLSNPPQNNGLTAFPGDPDQNVGDVATTEDGRACWQVGGSSSHGDLFVYVSVGSAFKHSGLNDATIGVQYYDEAPGNFAINYDAQNNVWQDGLTVPTTGSDTWKSASVFVTDAVFENQENGADIRISLYDPSFGQSSGPLCIGQVSVTPSPIPTQDVEVNVTQQGNVFSPGQAPSFGLYAVTDDVDWTVTNYTGRQMASGSVAIDPTTEQANFTTPVLPVGYYTLSVTAEQGGQALKTRSTGFAVLPPGPDLSSVQSSIFGVNTHESDLTAGEVTETEALASRAGIKNDRDDDSYWSNIEQQPGVYTFGATNDNVVTQIDDSGKTPLLILGYGNSLYDDGATPYTSAAIQAFGAYAAAVATHYGSQVPALEVWNEPNGGFTDGPCAQSPNCYFQLLKSVYTQVKAVSPNTQIVGAAAFKTPHEWFTQLFKDGGLNYMDAISIHPYRSPGLPEGLEDDVAQLQSLVKQYNGGQSKPIWITEQGWSSGTSAVSVSDQTQADYLVRSVVLASGAGVAKYFWYDLLNDGTDATNDEDNFGLLRQADLNADGITPKPAYVAYATASRMLTGLSFESRQVLDNNTAFSYHFGGSGAPVDVLWSDKTEQPTDVTVPASGPVTLTDIMGNSRTLTPVNGTVLLTLTGDPIYLSGTVGAAKVAPVLAISGPSSPVAVGSPVPLTLSVDNSRGPIGGNGVVKATFQIDGRSYDVAARPGQTGITEIAVPAETGAGTRTYVGDVTVDGVDAGYAVGHVNIVNSSVTASVGPSLSGSGTNLSESVAVTVNNAATQGAIRTSSINWSYGNLSGTSNAAVTVPPSSTRTVTIPVSGVPYYQINSASVTVNLTKGTGVSAGGSFGFSPVTHATPTMVNGTLSGLADVPPIDLATVGSYSGINSSDVSGTMWVAWDSRYLYVAAEAKEASYTLAASPYLLQAGDSVGIGIQPGVAGAGLGTWGAAWHNLYAGQSATGPAVYQESLPVEGAVGLLSNAKVQVSRDATTQMTTYLIAIPWSDIAPVSPSSGSFSMVLTLNKNNQSGTPAWGADTASGSSLAGWEEWADGLNNFVLTHYQTVILTN